MKRLHTTAIFVFVSLWLLSGCTGGEGTTTGIDQMGTQSVQRTQVAASTLTEQKTQAVSDSYQATQVADQLRATAITGVIRVTMTAEAARSTSAAIVAGTQQSLQITSTTQAIIAQANEIYYQQQQQQIDIRRRQMLNTILGITLFLIILGVLALLAWLTWIYVNRLVNPHPMGGGQAHDPWMDDDYSTYRNWPGGSTRVPPAAVVKPRYKAPPGAVSPAAPENRSGLARVRRVEPPSDLPSSAPWSLVLDTWRGDDLPVGLSPDGMVAIDPRIDPHLLVTGTPGSGKANLAVRPVIAEALALGWRSVIFDRAGNDFQVFQRQPNADLVLLNEEGPGETISYLRRLYQAVQRRREQLSGDGGHEWAELPNRPADLLAVFNNFSYEVGSTITVDDRKELWNLARLIAAEGGAVGMHLMLVMEDPSFTDMDLRIRRSMAPVAFRAGSSLISRVVLNLDGAENLYPRQFITVLAGQLEFGIAFTPDNYDLKSFLARHPQPALPRPEWLNVP